MIKENILLVVLGLALSSCSTMGFTDNQNELIQTASFDQKCPAEKISVLERFEGGIGITKYVLEICGKKMKYLRMGTSYFEDGKQPVMSK